MAKATITVTYQNNTVSVSPSTINGSKSSTVNITWATGTGVAKIKSITRPTTPDGSGELDTPTLNSNRVWKLSDNLGTMSQTYNYNITILTTGNNTVTVDWPQIINNPNTGTV